jgi:hypothetical protein
MDFGRGRQHRCREQEQEGNGFHGGADELNLDCLPSICKNSSALRQLPQAGQQVY